LAKIDEIKERISLYKFFLGIIVGIFLSIVGYTFNNYQHLKTSLMILIILSLIILLYIFIILISIIFKNIEKLKDL